MFWILIKFFIVICWNSWLHDTGILTVKFLKHAPQNYSYGKMHYFYYVIIRQKTVPFLPISTWNCIDDRISYFHIFNWILYYIDNLFVDIPPPLRNTPPFLHCNPTVGLRYDLDINFLFCNSDIIAVIDVL